MKDEIKEKIKAYYMGNDIDEVLDYITNLQEENERLIISLSAQEELTMNEYYKKNNYKSRNEKAIEYIKSLCYIESKNEWFTYGDDLSPEHIVNILQGEDKDVKD